MALIRSQYMPLVLFAAGTALVVCTYQSAGAVPSRGVEIISSMSWMVFMLVWMESDARHKGGQPCYDFGFLSALVFPLSLDGRPRESHVGAVSPSSSSAGEHLGRFRHRHRLSGQRRFLHLQIADAQQTQIGGERVS